MAVGSSGTYSLVDPAARLDRVPRRLQDADGRGPERRHVAGRDGPGPRLRHAALPVVAAGRRLGRALRRTKGDTVTRPPGRLIIVAAVVLSACTPGRIAPTASGAAPTPARGDTSRERDTVRIGGRLALDRRPPARCLARRRGRRSGRRPARVVHLGRGRLGQPVVAGNADRASVPASRSRSRSPTGRRSRPGPPFEPRSRRRAGPGRCPPARAPARSRSRVAVPGRWTVAVTIRFDGGDSATWFWQLDVT